MLKKIFLFISLFTFTTLIFSCTEKKQRVKNVTNIYKTELENGTWITNKILALDPNMEQYSLTKFTEQKFAGNLTRFSDKINFNSRNVSPCGNDYFTTVTGKYEFFDKDKINISVDSVTYHGEWKKPTEHRKPKDLVFLISKTKREIILKVVKD